MSAERKGDWSKALEEATRLGHEWFKALPEGERRQFLIKVGALTPDGEVAPAFREAVLRKRAGEAAE